MSPSARGIQRRLNIAPLNFDDSSNSPVKMPSEDMSLYSGNTPQGSPRPCSISNSCLDLELLSPYREHERIEERHDIDFNSMDSNYSNNSRKMFTFAQPSALPPKTMPLATRTSPKSISCFRSFNSLSSDSMSMESMDDDCMDLLDMESMDDNAQLPTSFNSIMSGNIKSINNSGCGTPTPNAAHNESTSTTPMFRRCLSMTDANVIRSTRTLDTLKTIPEINSPFQSKLNVAKTFKRPEPPTVGSPVQSKRYKQSDDDKENSNDLPVVRPVLRKSVSMNEDIIMNALSRCKYSFALPITCTRNQKHAFELKNLSMISSALLYSICSIIRNRFDW